MSSGGPPPIRISVHQPLLTEASVFPPLEDRSRSSVTERDVDGSADGAGGHTDPHLQEAPPLRHQSLVPVSKQHLWRELQSQQLEERTW